jgi:hypothetical protein
MNSWCNLLGTFAILAVLINRFGYFLSTCCKILTAAISKHLLFLKLEEAGCTCRTFASGIALLV